MKALAILWQWRRKADLWIVALRTLGTDSSEEETAGWGRLLLREVEVTSALLSCLPFCLSGSSPQFLALKCRGGLCECHSNHSHLDELLKIDV